MSDKRIKDLAVRQLELWGSGVRIPNREIFKIGLDAPEVVRRLFLCHEVTRFTYTKYNPEPTFFFDVDQHYFWSNWVGVPDIRELSQKIYEGSREALKFEGDEFVSHEILGIGSKVKLEGKEILQMRMLDLDIGSDENPMEAIEAVGLTPGVLLETDRSFHYYGFDLLTRDRWRVWMKELISLKESQQLFDPLYLRMCLDRGYTALRVFGYEETSKKKSPVIVARV